MAQGKEKRYTIAYVVFLDEGNRYDKYVYSGLTSEEIAFRLLTLNEYCKRCLHNDNMYSVTIRIDVDDDD